MEANIVLGIVIFLGLVGVIYGYFTVSGSGIAERPYNKGYGGARGADPRVRWGEKAALVAVQGGDHPPPAGFEGVEPVATGATIYPGLIELHNHLAYNALRLWHVPKLFTNRDQWGRVDDYRK